ncbi:MurR/RpiR family transcriptional regulator [Actinoplanes awajinensis]|uniref:MurR/RpiR family transcriptional regulator n=1 Tax=Actinoplanes awajinensis TaxID=135946 RepID=UPI0009FCAC7B|nr:MurR/RpiR family transcriptional regulator [Actinoplanes awajinensis]
MEHDGAVDWLLNLAQAHRLSPAQRQIVRRMLGMFPDVAFLSTIEIAERTGVSQPTVTRLATALGFAGFPEFRAALRDAVLARIPEQRGAGTGTDQPGGGDQQDLEQPGGNQQRFDRPSGDHRGPERPGSDQQGLGQRGGDRQGVSQHGVGRHGLGQRADLGGAAIEQERANLARLHRVVSGDLMSRAVHLLAGTTPLGVVGLRASAALAQYFGYFARRVLPAVSVCTDAGEVDDAVLQLSQQGATALLVFAMPRYPAGTVAAVRLARSLGLATVVIADTALVPFADDADVLLVAPVGTGLVFDSHAAVVTLAISLLDAITKTDPQRTQQRLEAHESLVPRWSHDT